MLHLSSAAARSRAGAFKSALIALTWLAILTGCATQRRCLQKFPPPPADTVTQETVTYRDTTLYVMLPADTVRDSIPVMLPCPQPELSTSRVSVRNRYANAQTWIANGKLHIDLQMNSASLAITIDSLAATKTKTVTITKTVIVKEKYVPPFYRAMLFVSIFLAVLFVLIIVISLRR